MGFLRSLLLLTVAGGTLINAAGGVIIHASNATRVTKKSSAT